MSRGRKPAVENYSLNWSELFNKNIGSYLQQIIVGLGSIKQTGSENSMDLLSKIRNYNAERKHIKTYKLVKNDEKPYEIPDNWIWCRLGEIIEVSDNLNIESKLSKDTLINYVDIDAIDNKNYQIRESKLKPVSELSSRARRVLKKGYVVYSLVRPYLNNIAIIEDEKTNYIGSTGFSVFNGIFIENKFLKYYLLTDYVRELSLSFLSGFNSPSISYEQFTSALVPLPPVSEQKKILEFLDDLGSNSLNKDNFHINEAVGKQVLSIHLSQLKTLELGSELSHQLHLVRKLRQQLLQDAVQGKLVKQDPNDEPATILLEKIKAEKKRLIKDKKLKKEKELPKIKPEEITFDIPENWVWCMLGEMSINCDGERIPISQSDRQRREKIFDYYGASGVIDKIDGYTHDGEFLLIGEDGANLVARSTPIAFIATGQFWVNNHAHVIKILDRITLDFICNYFNAIDLKPYITGGFQPKLSQGNLNIIPIPLPPLVQQHRIVQKIKELMETCDALEASIKQSQLQNEQLLQQVLREALTKEVEPETAM